MGSRSVEKSVSPRTIGEDRPKREIRVPKRFDNFVM